MWKEIIDEELIFINPDVKDKKDLFEGMVNHVYNKDYIRNRKRFLKALWEREEKSNTELIPGVALPHARSNSVEKLFVCIIVLKNGLDYNNPEMGPVQIVFFFGCSENHNKEYLQLLAQSSRVLRDSETRKKIIDAQKPSEIIEILEKFDEEEKPAEENKNYLLILTLNDVSKSSEVVSAMVEVGITNASIIDSVSMAKKLAYEMPLFAGLSYMAGGKSKESQIIFCHIPGKQTAYKLAELLKKNGIDLNRQGTGFIQTIEVKDIIGNFEEDIDL
ncbi:MAG: hypothetical protein DRZ79_02495 [Candidatus Cloacimonadota bacterium]|nr:MAG: hypothetical protein DRZ79_02495 [Candidatus Cloacimonadota bacterium]